MGTRLLDDLSRDCRPLVVEVLARLTEHGLCFLIVQTLRTEAEHRANLANGTSRVTLSKHLPRRVRGWQATDRGGLPYADADRCDAVDLCPYETWALHGPDKLQWDAADPAWQYVGLYGEAVGLRWGGRWQQPHDPGHLELLFPGERYRDIPATSPAFALHGPLLPSTNPIII